MLSQIIKTPDSYMSPRKAFDLVELFERNPEDECSYEVLQCNSPWARVTVFDEDGYRLGNL